MAASKRRLTVAEAASELGTTSEGVRSRIKRGTLQAERESGRVWVILETAPPRPDAAQPEDRSGDRADLVEELRERVAFLERELETRTEENRRKDHLLAAALERIPALEPPESPETDAVPRPGTQAPPEPPPAGLVQQVGATATTTLVGQAALAAFQAFSVLKGNIRLAIILGVGQALLLAGTLLYVRRQRRLPSMPPLEGGQVGPQERPQEGPQGHVTPSIFRLVLWSLLTATVVFAVAIVFYIYVGVVSVL